jgi:hypothetical protein
VSPVGDPALIPKPGATQTQERPHHPLIGASDPQQGSTAQPTECDPHAAILDLTDDVSGGTRRSPRP